MFHPNRQKREHLNQQMEEIISAMKVAHLDPESVAHELSRIREEDRSLRSEIAEAQGEMINNVASRTTEGSPTSAPTTAALQVEDKFKISHHLISVFVTIFLNFH